MFVYKINETTPAIDWVIEFNDHMHLVTAYDDLPNYIKYGYNGQWGCVDLIRKKKEGEIKRMKFWLKEYDINKATKIAEEYYANKKHQITFNELLNNGEI